MNKQNKEPDISDAVVGIDTPDSPEDGAATDMLSEFVKQTIDNIQHAFEDKPDNPNDHVPNK